MLMCKIYDIYNKYDKALSKYMLDKNDRILQQVLVNLTFQS